MLVDSRVEPGSLSGGKVKSLINVEVTWCPVKITGETDKSRGSFCSEMIRADKKCFNSVFI